AGARVLTRGGLSGVVPALDRLPAVSDLSPRDRALALARALTAPGAPTPGPHPAVRPVDERSGQAASLPARPVDGPDSVGHTTNITVVDAEGNACVTTTSLGLGSGDFLPGLDVHLNSMLGEADLARGPREPGARMDSMMAPTLAVDDEGLALGIGSAGSTRIRSALVQVLAGVLDERVAPSAAVERPRLHPVSRLVHTEPGYDEEGLAALADAGWDLCRWATLHHYFGGVSLVARTGAGADPRRDGAAVLLGG
ncbi:MAG: gamma-glutamyltransferase family protein, partial [Actinomycetota bacterium]|nr:gamma-glutamyltransferase family protein [Actinomycetota bacterium]